VWAVKIRPDNQPLVLPLFPKADSQRGQLMGRFKAQKWQKTIFQRGAFDRSLVAVVAAKSQNSDHLFICAETSGM
jgi:hypothetical protein